MQAWRFEASKQGPEKAVAWLTPEHFWEILSPSFVTQAFATLPFASGCGVFGSTATLMHQGHDLIDFGIL